MLRVDRPGNSVLRIFVLVTHGSCLVRRTTVAAVVPHVFRQNNMPKNRGTDAAGLQYAAGTNKSSWALRSLADFIMFSIRSQNLT